LNILLLPLLLLLSLLSSVLLLFFDFIYTVGGDGSKPRLLSEWGDEHPFASFLGVYQVTGSVDPYSLYTKKQTGIYLTFTVIHGKLL